MPTPTTPTTLTLTTTTTTPTVAALGLLALAMLAHVSVSEAAAAAHKCFVCSPQSGSAADNLRGMFPGETLPTCDRFRPEEAGRFVRDCPAEYHGCLTVTNGTHVTRTCSEHPVDDCKFANGIKYCYCGRALCNRATDGVQATPPGLTDDEDLSVAEGSGAGGSSGTYRHREPHATPSSATPAATPTPTPTPSHGKSGATQRTDVSFAVVVFVAMCALV